MKILIVDDEQLDLFITKKLLGLEFEVEGFTSVSAASNWAASNSFDFLVIDYYLSDGLLAQDALNAIRGVAKSPVKAFVLSNHIDDHQAIALKEAGFLSIIDKPVTMEKFRDAIRASGGAGNMP